MIAGYPAAQDDLDLFAPDARDPELLLHDVNFPRCEYNNLGAGLEPGQLLQDGKYLVVPSQQQHVVAFQDLCITLAQCLDAAAHGVVDQRDQYTEDHQSHE